ncbi:MAG: SpaA isopeptide-forming pilin-related protein, partial [Ruminococcus flavefaciens]|nr:SpaA isopeptide-forming pilin-related protein [Ruminococcus flavefaciens]
AMLTVIDKDGNVVDRWTSVADEAHVIKRLAAGETYTLREEFAPYGYLKAEEIQFTVEDTADIQSAVMKDEVPTGAIIINKDGEFVTDTTLMKGHWYDFIFNYFKDSLAGVEFEVYAAEDIVSPDGLDTIYYEADELVATIVTDEKGYAGIDNLPLGKYYLVETKTLEGFVLDDTPIEADLSYIDQDTKVVYAGMNISNERQKVQITVVKKEAGTKEVLEGAVFGLFAKEDIVNKDGKVVVKAGTEIERGVTGKDGKLTFVSDLPLGKYYVQELTAPKGYVKSDKVFDVDASYQGDDKAVIEFEAEFENKPIKVQISKTDITGDNELEGAVLSVIDADGNLVEKWTSGKEPHMIEKLPAGKYILREETAPFGYVIAQDIEFEVKETDEIQKVAMKDEAAVGKIIISKKSEDGKALAGAKFEIRDKDGKVIETLTTDKDGHAESGELPIATFKDGKYEEAVTYTVVEVEAPEGYLLDSTPKEVKFEYKDGKTRVVEYTLEVTNKPTEPKLPQTGDNMNPWVFAG